MRRVAVYCGSSESNRESYRLGAARVGELLATRGIEVVYGGGNCGLMGIVADAALSSGGRVTGVIPTRLVGHEVAHAGLSELIVVDSMHARKTVMSGLSDAFFVLPGGFGTLDELFEATTWTQLGYHQKPVGLLDIDGYFEP
ncbi:MAG: TIGR00730 family Rossman fold protein, partial [Polyangiaceae bacterium]|nr:TIGR00730 family Rossman fold protein [Polyangiaceae bacterium]